MVSLKPVVYIAGPYTNPDPVENIHRAIKIADGLLDVCTPLIPHLSGTWHMVSPKPYEEWLRIDLDYMVKCDAVYRFPGQSSGADAEVDVAHENNMVVFFSEEDLREWIATEWHV